MKKSQLRKVIRESIKQLMVEQMSPLAVDAANYSQNMGSQNLQFHICDDEALAGGINYSWIINSTNSGGCCGHIYGITFNGWYHGLGYGPDITTDQGGHYWTLVQAIQSGNPINGWYGTQAECLANCTDTDCNTSPPSGCDPNGPLPQNFNLSTWTNQWTNSGPFNNTTNANHPCNFICGKVTTFTNNLALNPGPAQTNMLECKLEEAMSQYVTHGCAQVNSNNCPI